MGFLGEVVYGAVGAALPLIRGDLGLSYAQLGLLASLPLVVGSAVELPVGLLASGRRRRRLVLVGGLAFAAALGVVAAAPDFAVLLAGMTLLASASGAFVSLSEAAVVDADPARGEQNLARWIVAGSVGSLLAPMAVAAGAGWRMSFGAMAAATLLVLDGIRRTSVLAATEPPRPVGETSRQALRALRDVDVVRWLVLLEASDLLLDVLTGFLAVYLVDVVGASIAQAALAVAVRLGAGLVGELALVPLLTTRSGSAVLRWTAAAALVVYPALLAVPGLGPKLVLLALLSVLTAAWYPVLAARLYASLPGQSGVVVSVSTVSALVGGLLPAVLGLVAERFGLAAAMAAMAAAPVVILVGVRPAGRPEAAPDMAA